MRHLTEVIQDMRETFSHMYFKLTPSNNGPDFSWIHITSDDLEMKIEVCINYQEESVIACLVQNSGFGRKAFSLILDTFLDAFDEY